MKTRNPKQWSMTEIQMFKPIKIRFGDWIFEFWALFRISDFEIRI